MEINTKFTVCEVIFGIPNDNDQYVQMINYIIWREKNGGKSEGREIN